MATSTKPQVGAGTSSAGETETGVDTGGLRLVTGGLTGLLKVVYVEVSPTAVLSSFRRFACGLLLPLCVVIACRYYRNICVGCHTQCGSNTTIKVWW